MKHNINLTIDQDNYELNDYLYASAQFGTRPNKIIIHNTYSTILYNSVISSYILEKNSLTEIIPDGEDSIINDKMCVKINENIYCSYIILDRESENSIVSELTFFYKDSTDLVVIQEIIELLNSCVLNYDSDDSRLSILSFDQNLIEIEPIYMEDLDTENFDLYYSNDTMSNVNKLIKNIKKHDKGNGGLSIFYGENGTGKTSIIKYLASKMDRNVIFIPNNMIEHSINNPEFRTIMKQYKKSIVILDDCELLFDNYQTRSNIFINNLLQITDGFLSDLMDINFITIFNTNKLEDINNSLINSNNLVDIIKFNYLSKKESNELSDFLRKKSDYSDDNKVIDIVKNKKANDKKGFGL